MSFDPQLQQAIAAHMQYLRDLGIYDFYRRDTETVIEPIPEESVIPPRQPVSPQPPIGSFVAPPSRVEALRAIQFEIGDCTRCALSVEPAVWQCMRSARALFELAPHRCASSDHTRRAARSLAIST